ncbi:MAG: class I SAM-dependent methyltransferase [Bacteroidota bacterium]|nr:class I SAM-dependent methyltransferase [Bacteroidota bacterium]MDP4213241.1 class I SAM-dependent methyltransferase [Bacteroidota bacterium]MDP4250763.1 class I SAM-dependent methyltransferase [Bacteroidota bacterium]
MGKDYASFKPTTRFSNRVDNYTKYRPGYPPEIVRFLEETLSLNRDHQIADIGSGTGIFTEILLKHGYQVTAVEPNDEMRKVAEQQLRKYPGFTSSNHTAEKTGLSNHSVQLITAAQAFHWMEPVAARKEFERILIPNGHVALIWNVRLKNTPFLQAIEDLKLKYGTDYKLVSRADEDAIDSFFKPNSFHTAVFQNIQWLDQRALEGQLLSSSYIPLENEPGYTEMLHELSELFHRHNEKGFVNMEFQTKLFYGKLDNPQPPIPA